MTTIFDLYIIELSNPDIPEKDRIVTKLPLTMIRGSSIDSNDQNIKTAVKLLEQEFGVGQVTMRRLKIND